MAKTESKMPLPKLDDLFTTEEERDNAKLEKVVDINLSDIDDFPNHPFKVIDNEEMEQMKDSIIENGDYSTGVYDGNFFAFATLNSEGNVYEIADGTWMFAMTPEEYEKVVGKDVRAVLFRVNDAKTNEGERVTSTSMKTHLPSYNELKNSVIEGGN